ncbi:MAG: O-methyltransferase [Bacteroidetes bacterium]|nr:O-methyltransferase [Bacteroidota bacterium]MBS1739676.1 O-methyltransferase [Bacteroidota bacterium]
MTTQLLSKSLNDYAESFTTKESPALARLNRETHLKIDLPIMLSGHLQGAVLSMLSHMIKPRRVLEIGTYTGYSAICLAQGLASDGVLHTIDVNEEIEAMAFRYFCEAGLEKKICQHVGKAASIIPGLDEVFDLVFIDADKQGYSHYYDLIFDKVCIGGYILADNVFYDGEVILPEEERSKNAKAIHAFNVKVKNDHRVEHVLLPIRDGIMVIRKMTT